MLMFKYLKSLLQVSLEPLDAQATLEQLVLQLLHLQLLGVQLVAHHSPLVYDAMWRSVGTYCMCAMLGQVLARAARWG